MTTRHVGDEARIIRPLLYPLQQESVRTCSIAPPAKPTTSARPPQAIHLSASTELINIRDVFASFCILFWGVRTFNLPDRIIYYVDAAPASDVHDMLLPTVLCIVDYNVCTARHASNLKLAWRCCGNNTGANRFNDFQGERELSLLVRGEWTTV